MSVAFDDTRDGGSIVRFEHGGWTDANVAVREKFGDWPLILGRFVALADDAVGSGS